MQTTAPVYIAQKPVFDVKNAINAVTTGSKSSAQQNAKKVAEEFEASFLTTYFAQMFAGLSTDGPFGGGYGETVYRDMMTEQYAKATASAGGIGIATQVYSEILRMQEANNS